MTNVIDNIVQKSIIVSYAKALGLVITLIFDNKKRREEVMSKQIWLHLWYSGLLILCVSRISHAVEFVGDKIHEAICKDFEALSRTTEQMTAKIEQSVNRLTAELQNVDLQRVKFQRFLQYEVSGRFEEVHRKFQYLMEVGLGNYNPSLKFFNALCDCGIKMNLLMGTILDSIHLNPNSHERKLKICVAEVAELGFTEGGTVKDVANKILKLGYELCSVEVSAEIALQYGVNDDCIFIPVREPGYDNYVIMELSRESQETYFRAIRIKHLDFNNRLVFLDKR